MRLKSLKFETLLVRFMQVTLHIINTLHISHCYFSLQEYTYIIDNIEDLRDC